MESDKLFSRSEIDTQQPMRLHRGGSLYRPWCEPSRHSSGVAQAHGQTSAPWPAKVVPALLEDASLWQAEGPSVRQVAVVAAASDFATSAETRASLEHAFRASSLVVGALFQRRRERLSYAFASPDRRFAIYAEQNVPADRKSAVANNSAFSDLYYAIYLGDSERPAALLRRASAGFPRRARPQE